MENALKEETFANWKIHEIYAFRGNKLSRTGRFFENFTTSEFAELVFQSIVKIMRNSIGRFNWRGNCIFTSQELKYKFFALLAK